MQKMLRDQNPGLARRFDPTNALYFDDFTDAQLELIMMRMAKGADVQCPFDVRRRAVKELGKLRALPNFGNAGPLKTS